MLWAQQDMAAIDSGVAQPGSSSAQPGSSSRRAVQVSALNAILISKTEKTYSKFYLTKRDCVMTNAVYKEEIFQKMTPANRLAREFNVMKIFVRDPSDDGSESEDSEIHGEIMDVEQTGKKWSRSKLFQKLKDYGYGPLF